MLLIIALVIASLFVYFLKDKLKQYPNIFYIGAAVVTIVIFSLRTVAMPQFVRQNIVGIFAKGTIGTAFFIIVMITGALPRGSKLIGPLMRIRGELSIMAAILVLSHNLTYGMTYFKMLFSAPAALPAVQRCAAVISLILIVLMIGLTVISFPAVRKKMNPKKWKQIQRSAYVFYGLLYVHIMLINIPYARMGLHMYAVNVLVYSIVFAGYAAMRIRKWLLTKNPDADSIFIKKVSVAVSVCAVLVCTAAFSICFMRNGNKVSAQETAADKTSGQTQTEKGVKKNGEAGTTSEVLNPVIAQVIHRKHRRTRTRRTVKMRQRRQLKTQPERRIDRKNRTLTVRIPEVQARHQTAEMIQTAVRAEVRVRTAAVRVSRRKKKQKQHQNRQKHREHLRRTAIIRELPYAIHTDTRLRLL